MGGLVKAANQLAGGTVYQGVSEITWLKAFLANRRSVLLRHDPLWADSVTRVDIYSKLLEAGAAAGRGRAGGWGGCERQLSERSCGPRPGRSGPPSIPHSGDLYLNGPIYVGLKAKSGGGWQINNAYCEPPHCAP